MSIASYAVALRALQTLDGRSMPAMMAAHPGRVTPESLKELRGLNDEYRALLADCTDDFLLGEVRRRVADSQEWVARACDALGLAEEAAREFETAAADWETAGEPEKATHARETERRSGHVRSGMIDPEFERLHAALLASSSATLEHTQLLVELAELYINAGDDFEAEPLLREAEEELRVLALTDVDGNRLAAAMQATLTGVADGTLVAGSTPLEAAIAGRSLQIRVSLALGQVERDRQAEMAAAHLLRARELDEVDIGPLAALAGPFAGGDASALLGGDAVIALRRELDLLHVEIQLDRVPADELVERARGLETRSRRLGIAPFVAVALMRQADLLLQLGRPRQTLAPLAEAERCLGEERRHDLLPMILRARAKACAALREWPAVSEACAAGIALVEDSRQAVSGQHFRDSYLRARVDLYGLGALAALELGDAGLAVERMELAKARSTVRPLGSARPATEQELERLSRRIDELRAAGADVTELLRRRRVVWDLILIERLKAGSTAGTPESALPAVQARLAPDEAVLYHFWLRRDRLLLATLDRGRAHFEVRSVSSGEREMLEAFVATLLGNPPSVGFVDRVQRFAELMLPEDRSVLEGKQRLIVSPHRALHGLPVHALEWAQGPLVRSMAVTYVPNLASLMLDYEPAPAGPLLVAGIRDYRIAGAAWPPLEQAPLEADDIAALYRGRGLDATTLIDGDATEDTLGELARSGELACFARLHFATHGDSVGADTPMESFLCLNDSLLDGLDIARWRLRAEVAVLSACCSGQRSVRGRGQAELPGDELFGLQAAFFAAGVRRVIGCLWKVRSSVARKISIGLHRRLLDGLPPDIALQRSVVEYIDDADLVHRKADYWGPFFLSAIGRPLSHRREHP